MLTCVVLHNHALLVVGPHRSGTSALTRVLNLLGADLGTEALQPKFDNPHGYWEHREVFNLHERLLSRLGSAWHEYAPLPDDGRQREDVAEIVEELRAILVREFGDSDLWTVKDPRLCRLLPVWIDLMDGLRVDARFVLVVRHPLEVARSLDARGNDFSWSKCILLYLADTMNALRHTEGRPRAFVSYSHLLEDWRRVADRVAQSLELEWPRSPAEAAAEIDAFLRPSARHHRLTITDLDDEPGFPTWARDLYAALEQACEGRTRVLDESFPDLYEAFTEARGLFLPEVARYRRLLEESQASHRQTEAELAYARERLDVIFSSPLYRYSRPLRRLWQRLFR